MILKKKKIPQETKVLKYTWNLFDRDIQELIQRLNFKPKSIVCIAVGGVTIGAKLRNLLSIPLTIISTASYRDTQRQKTLTLNSSYVVPIQSPVLLVDDIVDTGYTMKIVKEHLELGGIDVKTAALFYKDTSIFKPDYYIHKTNRWVVFPWER